MALNGIQIFKLTPKKNCKECGCPTCMAFSMKVAQGALTIDKCPHMSQEALDSLSAATAPPMKTVKFGTGANEYTMGGETVLYRHEKTFVNKTRYAVAVCSSMSDEEIDAKLEASKVVDYERIGEQMHTEAYYVSCAEGTTADRYVELVKKVAAIGKPMILDVKDVEIAKAALAEVKAGKPILNGATPANYAEMSAAAKAAGVVLGVTADTLDALYDTVAALEKGGNKELVLDTTGATIKETFANTVQVRRAALKNEDRTFGYPSIVNVARLTKGDKYMAQALASVFTMKYGSIVVLPSLNYDDALPLFGLRQNVFTDPQKPMKVAPGVYPLNGADENSIIVTTVDFALTYFVVSGELERSGVPINLVINDAGGLSVLTSWAAGKFSSTSIAKYFNEEVANKVACRKVVIPGKVAVLKGDLEAKMPGWEIIVAPREAVELVKFFKDMQANGEL